MERKREEDVEREKNAFVKENGKKMKMKIEESGKNQYSLHHFL